MSDAPFRLSSTAALRGARALLSRRALAVAALTFAAFSASGVARANEAGVLRVVSPWEWTSNEPADTGYLMSRLQIAETLVMVEPDGRLVGGVAEDWAVSEDRLTWRFRVREGVTFHDGSPVTAQAVVGSLRRALGGESLQQVPVASIEADGRDVVIRTRTPFSTLPATLVDYASVILAPASFDADGKVGRVIGSGPFRIVSQDGRTTLELERFETYRGERAKVGRVRYTAVPSGDTRTNVAVAGDADLIFTTVPSATPRIDASGAMKVTSLTVPRVRVLAFNSGLPQFADVRVRRAVSLAIDRAGMASAILRHPASASTQLLPPMLSDWHDPSLPPLGRDPAAANALLDEAGWARGPDGVRAKDGVRLTGRMLTIANRPELAVMGAAMQAQLRQVGMEITVEPGPSAAVPAAIRDGSMQMTFFARTYVNVPDVIATIIPDFTRERSTWGSLNWPGRERVTPLTSEYVASFDDARKAQLRREILRILHEEVPVTPVSWFEHTIAVNPRVSGLVVDPYEMRYMLHMIELKPAR